MSEALISPGGDRKMLLIDIANDRMGTCDTPPAEKEAWREWMVEHG